MTKKITILNLGYNNLGKITNFFNYLGFDTVITSNSKTVKNAEYLVLPGLGSYDQSIKILKQKKIFNEIIKHIKIKQRPIIGICLGMQILFSNSTEGKSTKGLNILKGSCVKLNTKKNDIFKIPNIGWREIKKTKKKSKFEKNMNKKYYFVHSYYVPYSGQNFVKAITKYDNNNICAIAEKNNILATQFHPELSGKDGLDLVRSFLKKI